MWKQIRQWFNSEAVVHGEIFTDIWTVDLHNHLLPNVDDGLQTREDTLLCLQRYVEWGIKRVICTPHISQDFYPNTHQQLEEAAHIVNDLILAHNLPLHLSLAAEYLLDDAFNGRIQQEELLSFGPERYVLFETGWLTAPHQLENSLFSMQLKGYTPILAHPERYHYYQMEPRRLMALKEKGCLFQLNLMSLAGRYGKKSQETALRLLKSKNIDFIGSDLHKVSDLATLQTVFTPTILTLLRQQPLLNGRLL